MNWFLAKLVFQIDINFGENDKQFDESYRLIQAASLADAQEKARSIGEQEEITFVNTKGEPVGWRFIDVPSVKALDTLHSGIEVVSITHEADHPQYYIAAVEKLAAKFRSVVSFQTNSTLLA